MGERHVSVAALELDLDVFSGPFDLLLTLVLLELKSRLVWSGGEEGLLDIGPEQAAEELLARMLDARRYRAASAHLSELLAGEHGVRFREAPTPPHLRRAIVQPQEGSQDPAALGEAIGRLLLMPPTINVRHIAMPRVSLAE